MTDEVYYNENGFDMPDGGIPTHEDMTLLATGDDDARQRIITMLMEYVVGDVDFFIKKQSYLEGHREDLVSTALLTLVETVTRFCGGKRLDPPQLWYTVKQAVQGACNKWVNDLPALHIHQRTKVRTKQDAPCQEELAEGSSRVEIDHGISEVDFEDFLETLNAIDRALVQCLIEGLSYQRTRARLKEAFPNTVVHVRNRLVELRKKFKDGYHLTKG